ncbi:MAG: hypothetical protein B7Z55_03300 [Planctomycetales bacterium 12-60-4]|nr:MAG: hypothetical protein B7Z55_03300 [Planctomycetales bacterium 12-60-4]
MARTFQEHEISKRARVLVIDDDPQIRSLLVAFLRREYLVSVASDGLEGHSKALEHTPDIAIIDIQMPGWDGLKTLRAFREHVALQGVRAIMLTADASRQTVMAAISMGADDYIIKTSLSKDELLQKLRRVLLQAPARPGNTAQTPTVRGREDHSSERPTTPASTVVRHDAVTAMDLGAASATATADPEVDPRKLQEMLDAWE